MLGLLCHANTASAAWRTVITFSLWRKILGSPGNPLVLLLKWKLAWTQMSLLKKVFSLQRA